MNTKPRINEDIILEGIQEFSKKHDYKPNYFDCEDIVYLYTKGFIAEYDDGYTVGKLLEEKFDWKMYVERVNELDEVHFNIRQAYYKAVREWLQKSKIVPSYKEGDIIEMNDTKYFVLGFDVIVPYSYKLHPFKGDPSKIDKTVYITMWCDDVDRESVLSK